MYVALSMKSAGSRLMEMGGATAAALAAAVALQRAGPPLARAAWLLIPLAWALCATVPGCLRGRGWSELGLRRPSGRVTVKTLLMAGVALAGGAFAMVWIARTAHWPLPLCPQPERGWLNWVVYQCLYVAVGEEAFFRGYLQNGFRAVLGGPRSGWRAIGAVALASAAFAAGHWTVLGTPAGLWVFFPSLLLGMALLWTDCLLAPILLHGLANVSYALACRLI